MAYWLIPAMLSVAGGLQSSSQMRKAGKEAMRQARADAQALRMEKFQVAELAAEQHADRLAQYSDFAASNAAYAAYMGRQDRSLQAIIRREQQKYGKDVDRIRKQEALEKQNLEKRAQRTIAEGIAKNKEYRSAARASLFNAVSQAAFMGIGGGSSDTSGSRSGVKPKPVKGSGSTGPSAPKSTKPGMDRGIYY